MGISYLDGLQFKAYLQAHYPEVYKELYHATNGWSTGVRRTTPRWFTSTVDSDDLNIRTLKTSGLNHIRLVWTVLLTYSILLPLLTYKHVVWF